MLTRHQHLLVFLVGLALILVALLLAMEPGRAHTAPPAGGAERIVFMSTRGGVGYAIWAMDPDGGNAVQLSHPGPNEQDYGPRISPDGRHIAFVRHVSPGSNYEVFVMDPDGSDAHNLTNNPAVDQGPSWSPDGSKIAFESDRDGFFRDVYVMNANGSGVVRLTDDPAYDGRPAWSPDGTKITFESQRDHSWTKIYTVPATGVPRRRSRPGTGTLCTRPGRPTAPPSPSPARARAFSTSIRSG